MFPRPILAAFGFGLLALPAHLLAQEGPSFECAAASTWGEELVCSDAALAALDLRLQGRFTAALAVAEARFPAALPDLRAMQRGWVKGRDDCWKGSDPRGCVEFNYLHREAELVAAWSLEEPTWVATYVCGDKGAEVTASFFETEIPAVRIDRAGETEAGVLDSFSEATRYSAYPGTSLVVDADDAWLQWRDGPEEMCALQS